MATDKIVRIASRAGYGARGVIYLIIGIFALLPVVGMRQDGGATSSKGALEALLSQPAGAILLSAVTIGLVGYAGWRALQAIANTDGHDRDFRGLVVRGGLLISAATHLALAAYAATLVVGAIGGMAEGGGGGGGKREIAAWLMRQPYGVYLVATLGGAIAGAGLAQMWKGASVSYAKWLDVPANRTWLTRPICTFGLIARGIVFCIVGGLFIYAAVTIDADQAGGLPEALAWLKQQAFGLILLTVMAIGLFAFGLYSVIEAIYRRVGLDTTSDGA